MDISVSALNLWIVLSNFRLGFSINCGSEWLAYDNQCFRVVLEGKTFHDAAQACNDMNSSLASMTSETQTTFMQTYLLQKSLWHNWIGLVKSGVCAEDTATRREGWFWLDNTQYVWQNWQENIIYKEPDNGECYASMGGSTGYWYGASSTMQYSFICEKHAGSSNCDGQWKVFGDQCYFLELDKQTFNGAEMTCMLKNASLASMGNKDETEFVLTIIPREYHNTSIWIGLKKQGACSERESSTREGWAWLNQARYEWQNWYADASHQEPNAGECYTSIGGASGKWYGSSSTSRYRFICEQPVYSSQDKTTTQLETSTIEPTTYTDLVSIQPVSITTSTNIKTPSSNSDITTAIYPSEIKTPVKTDQLDKIAIGVGVSLLVVLFVGAILFIILIQHRRRLRHGSHDILKDIGQQPVVTDMVANNTSHVENHSVELIKVTSAANQANNSFDKSLSTFQPALNNAPNNISPDNPHQDNNNHTLNGSAELESRSDVCTLPNSKLEESQDVPSYEDVFSTPDNKVSDTDQTSERSAVSTTSRPPTSDQEMSVAKTCYDDCVADKAHINVVDNVHEFAS